MLGYAAAGNMVFWFVAARASAQPEPTPQPEASRTTTTTPEPSLPTTPPPAPPASATTDSLTFELHGGAYIWLYGPLLDGANADLSLYFANLVMDANYKPFDVHGTVVETGFHFEPRFRDTKLRSYFGSNVWVQEAYGHAGAGPVVVKAGKVYTRFGKFWDNSFYGNLPYFDGLKLSPDLGVSAEIAASQKQPFRFNAYAQYFVNDGVTNGSLPNRDTVSVTGARKRNELVARVEPAYFFSEDASIGLGLSAQYFQADLPAPIGEQGVTRLGADVTLSPVKGLSIYADYAWQHGQHVTDYPMPGAASRHNHYLLTGAEYITKWRVTGRFNLSYVDYSDLAVTEILYEPGLVLKIHDHMSVIGEYVYWSRDQASMTTKVDHSVNLILYASF
jgi:hypothetical protein